LSDDSAWDVDDAPEIDLRRDLSEIQGPAIGLI
jgi:hypothetical protein